jgi:hypothetical protein
MSDPRNDAAQKDAAQDEAAKRELEKRKEQQKVQRQLDEALEDSFPASDPISIGASHDEDDLAKDSAPGPTSSKVRGP